jgi:hypothetical protein
MLKEFYEKYAEHQRLQLNCFEVNKSLYFFIFDLNAIILNYLIIYLKDFIAQSIFRIPKEIVLPHDQEIQESVKNYSKDEDIKLDQQLEELKSSINEVFVILYFIL